MTGPETVSTSPARWAPSFGAWLEDGGGRFRVWAPGARTVDLVLDNTGALHRLDKADDGSFSGWVAGLTSGARYRYLLDGAGPFPDPASRFQPDGVHGPSELVDPARFAWSDADWTGNAGPLVLYELHVGTFTPAGSFAGAAERLPYLRDLGVTAVELMPVADFPGNRNWGYDGVALFAPARCYGCPDDLRALVDSAHRLGLAVHLDVVYNHFGPDGAYAAVFSPQFFSDRHRSPWGAGINLDGPGSEMVRAFLIENALHWLHEYHFDGLRLDATHALADESDRHFLAELTRRVRDTTGGRTVLVIAEDHRNLAQMVRPEIDGGWGLDGVWADDFHHQVRRLLAGDREGYYRDFRGTTEDISVTLQQGWFFTGQYSEHLGGRRGTPAGDLPPEKFVICLQNHDQIGNRAMGDRLTATAEPAAFRAASALLLAAPETPLLFMGQEWAAATPFLYFTDHHEELGRLVSAGRRREFRHFSAFSDPAARERIPDPQDPATFDGSRLDWTELGLPHHAGMWRLYRALLALRRTEPALRAQNRAFRAWAPDPGTVVLERWGAAPPVAIVARLQGAGIVRLDPRGHDARRFARWTVVLSTEDPAFSLDPVAPVLTAEAPWEIRFEGPAAVVLKATG